MRLGKLSLMGLLAVGSILSTGSAFADSVSGVANISGAVTVTSNTIDFYHWFSVPVGATNTGSFTNLVGGTVNTTLTGGPTFGAVDPNVGKDFITFEIEDPTTMAISNIDFDLTYIEQGNVGGNSPFTFTQAGANVLVGLSLDGVSYYESSPGEVSSTTSGVYSTQLIVNGESIDDVIASVNAGNAITGQSYSATFTASPTPEPASLMLMGVGLLGAGYIGRRKAQAAKKNA
jgi:hypothetical protein